MSADDEELDLDFPLVRLRALYDYSYNDDDGHMITMNKGDEYHLISKSGDWWEVVRDAGSTNEFTFYVPATYVQTLDDVDNDSPRSNNSNESSSDNNNDEKVTVTKIVTGTDNLRTEMASTSSSDHFINSSEVGITFGKKGKSSFKKSSDTSNNKSSGIPVPSVSVPLRRSFSDDGDYVNLDKYRTDAGISDKNDGEATDSDYANFGAFYPTRQHEPPSPDVEKCDYIKTLLDVWDMFHDPETNRLFYINKETLERTWKPPRHPNKHERAQQMIHGQRARERVAKLDAKVNRTGIGILPEINVDQTLTNIPEGWGVEETKEGTVYTNEVNEERWMSSINTEGKRYFYKVGSTETAWELPKINNRQSNGDIVQELPSPQASPSSTRSKSPLRSPQIGRGVKARSMFIESSINFQHPPHFPTSPPPRAQTLPNNLNTQAGADPFSGTVNRAKIMEGNKKVKKNWVNCFAKLHGSNLVFYKDMKSSKSVPGSPYGKPDFMVPLQGCQITKATKDVSSKRNVVVINTAHGDQYLVQVEDDKLFQKLHIQLEIKINELGNQPGEGNAVFSLGPPEIEEEDEKLKRKTSFKRLFHSRTPSNVSGENSLEKPKSKWLQNFFTRRPAKELLEQKGIIKDAMFGSELKIVCDREKAKIPKFVMKCVVAIEKRGLEHDGIYRISGNQATIQKLRFQVDQDKYDLDAKEWDVYTLTGALKLFFRELKEPLLTFAMFDKAVPALMKDSNAERLKIFKDCVHSLPKNNFETFKFLVHHLLKVVELSKENRMEVQNIAIVFGPTLIWPQHENNHCIATNMVYQSRIVEYCLLEHKSIFK